MKLLRNSAHNTSAHAPTHTYAPTHPHTDPSTTTPSPLHPPCSHTHTQTKTAHVHASVYVHAHVFMYVCAYVDVFVICWCVCVCFGVRMCVRVRPSTHGSMCVLHRLIYIHIIILELSWIVTDTTTFELEFCGHTQATTHAHVQPLCVFLNFVEKNQKKSNLSKNTQRQNSYSNLLINSQKPPKSFELVSGGIVFTVSCTSVPFFGCGFF